MVDSASAHLIGLILGESWLIVVLSDEQGDDCEDFFNQRLRLPSRVSKRLAAALQASFYSDHVLWAEFGSAEEDKTVTFCLDVFDSSPVRFMLQKFLLELRLGLATKTHKFLLPAAHFIPFN